MSEEKTIGRPRLLSAEAALGQLIAWSPNGRDFSTDEAAATLSVGRATALRYLHELEGLGRLKRTGQTRATRWEVTA